MIHHVSVGTNDLSRARRFYDAVMPLLGLRLLSEDESSLDYGVGEVLFSLESPVDGGTATPGNGVHIAFAAQDPDMVDAFHRTALAHGGEDAGEPGLRPTYNPNYYGAFVYDPDGNKIEAVTLAARKAR
jgi:catechol 2,3-dioxygenase-like lactoylglutathione lyase family enzyme